MANTDENPVFSDMLTNIAVDAKWSVRVLIKTMDMIKLRIVMMLSVLADGDGRLTIFFNMKRNIWKKKAYYGIIQDESLESDDFQNSIKKLISGSCDSPCI